MNFVIGSPPPPPPELRTESEITRRWVDSEPLVSILCPTYQHAGFIEDALKGFLGQETDFAFEILVRDDASTDGTADIVRDYARQYPNIIRAIFERTNTWPEVKPSEVLYQVARGELVAICEGDDYWVDPRKLSVQASTLLGDSTVSLSFHDAVVIEDGIITDPSRLGEFGRRSRSPEDLMFARGYWLPTLSLMHRPLKAPPAEIAREITNLDRLLTARLGLLGSAEFEGSLVPGVHRRHVGGVWSMINERHATSIHAQSWFWIGCYFADQDEEKLAEHYVSLGALTLARHPVVGGVGVQRIVARRTGVFQRTKRRLSLLAEARSPRFRDRLKRLLRK